VINILDEIQLPAGELQGLLQRLQEQYLPTAEGRGLTLANQWVSPPMVRDSEPNTLWLQWQVADEMSYYAMRAGQTEQIATFWAEVDAIASERRRHVMVPAESPLPSKLDSQEMAL